MKEDKTYNFVSNVIKFSLSMIFAADLKGDFTEYRPPQQPQPKLAPSHSSQPSTAKNPQPKKTKNPQPEKTNQTKRDPIEFSSNGMVGSNNGKLRLSKNVRVTQGDFLLLADEATLSLDPKTKNINQIEAKGHVRVEKKDPAVIATGGRAVYTCTTKWVVLEQDATVEKDDQRIASQMIQYNLDSGEIVADVVNGRVNPLSSRVDTPHG